MRSFRFSPRLAGRANPPPMSAPARDVIRRFFDLIERLERPAHPPAPEVKARISRFDAPARRPSEG